MGKNGIRTRCGFLLWILSQAKSARRMSAKRLNAIRGRLFREARGEYICYLDGDDFYTDVHKLQKQADILDADVKPYLYRLRP